jgi:hypothetical protein
VPPSLTQAHSTTCSRVLKAPNTFSPQAKDTEAGSSHRTIRTFAFFTKLPTLYRGSALAWFVFRWRLRALFVFSPPPPAPKPPGPGSHDHTLVLDNLKTSQAFNTQDGSSSQV